MSVLRTILLDFGGTLDSEGLHWSTQFAQSFAVAGVAVERAALDHAFLAADRELAADPGIEVMDLRAHLKRQVELMLEGLGRFSTETAEKIARLHLERARRHLDRSVELLRACRERFRFGLVSNFTPNLPRIIEEVGLSEVLDVVICSEKIGLSKPDPEIFRMALARLNTLPEHAAMIGDSLVSDIMPAKALGLITIWLRGDRVFGQGDESRADHVVSSLSEGLATCERVRAGACERP